MKFETKQDVLNWYERQPQTLTPEFIGNINWNEVKNYQLDEKFVPVLLYMRDVEILTDMYYEELRRTPTGKDAVISKFMERWGQEELVHGQLIDRFLNESGYETSKNWQTEVRKNVPKSYSVYARIITNLTNLVGKSFTATHMTFGAINELCTAQGYRRLIELANHPVLSQILRGIMREESAHTQFYWSVAKLELQKSPMSQKIARFIIKNFWAPVGQGAKPVKESNYTIATLFKGEEGMDWIERNVSSRIQQLAGFEGLNTINEKIGRIITA
jgi:hypothetical protein